MVSTKFSGYEVAGTAGYAGGDGRTKTTMVRDTGTNFNEVKVATTPANLMWTPTSAKVTKSPTPIQKLEDQLVEIQLTQVGDDHDPNLKKHVIARQPNYVAKVLGSCVWT